MGDPAAVWATMPLGDLMVSVQNEAGYLASLIANATLDEETYQRAYWDHWRKLPEDWGVTIAQRDCELACQILGDQRRAAAALVDQQRVRLDAMVAVLRARSA